MAFISSKKSFLKAAASGDMSEINDCLGYNYDINTRDANGITVLSHAARGGHTEIMKKLLARAPDLEIPDNDPGYAALQAAIENGQTRAALLLIAAGADVNAHTAKYYYPIQSAAFHSDLDVVKALIDKGADLNTVIRTNGRTALHWAVDKEYGPVIEALVMAGARADIANNEGKTALDIARDKSPHTLKFLQDALARRGTAPAPAAAVEDVTTDSDVEVMKPLTLKNAAREQDNAPKDPSQDWQLMGDNIVAKVGTFPAMNRKLTEIFNFENKERVIISENLKTGAETLGQPEKFSALSDEIVAKAADQLQRLSGSAPKKSFNL
jgi:ankyrin repeat protein